MKSKLRELNVDIIGGQNSPMTADEQNAISNFIKQHKFKQNRKKLVSKISFKKIDA